MIIDELVIQNVGTFSGRNKIVLTPKSTAKPIVLVGGLNGAGKTTLLEAINLALYGALAQPTGRRGGGYEAYLKNLCHRGQRPNETSSVELTFRAHQQGKERRYRVARFWGGASGREHLEVDVDSLTDKALTSTWSEHVETFLPRGIAALFFFDGEQIEALADMEQSREVLNTALSALLGLDLVDRLGTDLGVLRRRHRMTQVPDALKARVEEKKQAAVAARQAEEHAVEASSIARVEYERLEKVHHEQAEHYRSAGGEMLDQRTATEQEVERNKKLLDDIENELREQASDAAPFLMVSGLLADLERQARLETTATTQRVVARELAERDQALLDLIVSMKSAKNLVGAVSDFLTSDRERRIGESEVLEITGLPDWMGVHTLRSSSLPVVERTVRTLIERRETIRTEIDQLERVLVSMPDPESIEDLRTRLDDAAATLTRQQATLALVEENLEMCRTERIRVESAHEAELDRLAQANLAIDDDMRVVAHIDKVKATLESLRVAATQRYAGRISALVLEALQHLLRKESLVRSVRIDPETYTVELTGNDNELIGAQQLSAGERQLLAVSLLWGLARAAGQPLPVVIDTPLGRLDGSHRQHLVERYFPYASHQVILLSTDTEIDERTHIHIKKHVGRSYCLEYDQETNATTVRDGYFWE